MSVHVVPEVTRELHDLHSGCWCGPVIEELADLLVTHQHRDDRPTQWLVIEQDDPQPN